MALPRPLRWARAPWGRCCPRGEPGRSTALGHRRALRLTIRRPVRCLPAALERRWSRFGTPAIKQVRSSEPRPGAGVQRACGSLRAEPGLPMAPRSRARSEAAHPRHQEHWQDHQGHEDGGSVQDEERAGRGRAVTRHRRSLRPPLWRLPGCALGLPCRTSTKVCAAEADELREPA